MTRRLTTAVVAAALLMLGGTTATTAAAQEADGLTATDLAFVEQQFDRLGVAESARADLLERIQAGILVDAEEGTAAPVASHTRTEKDFQVTRSVYPDGSVTELSVEKPRLLLGAIGGGGPSVMSDGGTVESITGCRTGMNTRHVRVDCLVAYEALTWRASHLADYNYGSTGAQIWRVRNALSGGIGVGAPKLTIITDSVGSKGTAMSQLKMRQNITILGIPTSRDVGFQLRVNRNGGSVHGFGL